MKSFMATPLWLLLGLWVLVGSALGEVELQEGSYRGLSVAFSADMPEPDDPDQLLQDLKSFLTAGSEALNTAVSGGLTFADVTVVIPRSWNASNFGDVARAAVELTSQTADILVHNEAESLPSTLQAELCGVPGRQISLPVSFLTLTEAQQQQYGSPGNILAHEWAHYRWGVHDEHGYGGDDVYKSIYGSLRNVTSCTQSANSALGSFRRSCPTGDYCSPGTADCFFCYDENMTSTDVKASLGYLPALSLGQFCDRTTHVRGTPTPQNLLCGERSVMEVMELHSDYTKLAQVAAAELQMTVVQEAFGRVLFLLEAPSENAAPAGQLPYDSLLDDLMGALLSHGSVDIAMASYKSNGSDVLLYNEMPFTTITESNYGDLSTHLPSTETKVEVDVALALDQVLQRWENYAPGTLVVLPVYNELILASTLDRQLGEALHARRIKPLLLYPESDPEMTDVAPFIQYSGARYVYGGDSSEDEVQKFLDYGYVNDHPIVKDDTVILQSGESYEGIVFYQEHVAQTRLAVVKASSVTDLTLSYIKYGSYRACDICNITSTTILLRQRKDGPPSLFYGTEWKLRVENNGDSEIEVSITWSEEYYIDKTDELAVEVWSSEGRQPVAKLPENQNIVLYASVQNYGDQVLSRRVQVKADLTIVAPDGSNSLDLPGVELLDDGNGVDIKRDDSVYSVDLAQNNTEVIPANSIIRVNTVYVLGNNPVGSGLLFRSKHSTSRKGSPQASGLLPRDPSEEDCCGSFVESPNIQLNHEASGFHLVLRDVVPLGALPGSGIDSSSITLKRDVDPNFDLTTTTTTTPSTAGPTTPTAGPTTPTAGPTTPTAGPTTPTAGPTTPTAGPTTPTAGPTTTESDSGDRGDAASLFVKGTSFLVVAALLLQFMFLQLA